jgi:hypothetical protein
MSYTSMFTWGKVGLTKVGSEVGQGRFESGRKVAYFVIEKRRGLVL